MAHASVYHLYNNEFRKGQGGQIGIGLNGKWYEPQTEDDVEAAENFIQFELGIYANPIFSEAGDFPSAVKERIAARSQAQGFLRSRLPELTPEEVAFIKGSSDFFGLNHYSTVITNKTKSIREDSSSPLYIDDVGLNVEQSDHIKVPWGLYNMLIKIRDEYNNPTVVIAENGFSTEGGLIDDDRIHYFRTHIDAVLDAIDDGCDVKLYTAWSLMDNFEWTLGYNGRFGLYEVDYESPERTRTPRKSAYFYKEMLRTRTLDYHYEPDMSLGLNVDDN
ncbi:unnamed protein product [Danaus chrysippus]|uniref:(African queen) hypothetical protein n=1 Tax=Danaus chrysippus TaxID=151541 RepID=A0A8J2QPL1_9NEOP|nr:unnamed protein product [Danaus chrysippus]